MHPAQKRAVFVILDSIEQQIRQVKTLLYADDNAVPVSRETSKMKQDPTYLSADEEERLERQMEQERLAALEQESKLVQELYAEAQNG